MKLPTIKNSTVRKGFRNGQALVDFPNGYTASVVCHEFSYGGDEGLFEIAVMYKDEIDYTTSVTSDVLGNLTEQAVIDICAEINALEPKD